MKHNSTRRSGAALTAMLFLSRIFGLMTLTNRQGAPVSAMTGRFIAVPFIPAALLFSVPALLLTQSGAGPACLLPGRRTPKTAAAYGLFFCLQASLGAALTQRFSEETMFGGGGRPAILALLIPAAVFCARRGERPLSAAAPAAGAGLLAVFMLITAATRRGFEAVNLQTFEETRALPLMLGGALAALRTPEIAAMIAMPEEESRTRVRSFFTAVCLTGVCVSLLFTLISGVTGRFGETQRFQFFTLTSLARIGSTERMDDLLYAAWIFTALLRTAFYTALAAGCFRAAGMKGRLLPLITAGAAALAFGTALGADTPLRRCFEQTEMNAAVCAVFSVLLPLLFLLKREPAAKKTGNRAGEEAAV